MTLCYLLLGLSTATMCVVLFARPFYRAVTAVWDRTSRVNRVAFVTVCLFAALYGGAKHATGKITYPRTDPTLAYLTDKGSYVTNDFVHIDFERLAVVPSSAMFYLDSCGLAETNAQGVATNWVTRKSAAFADLEVPFDFAFVGATNHNWVAYTDWTPAPAVLTNGVWHAYWGRDNKTGTSFIPVRTCVRENGVVIATPKSRWTSARAYVQDGLVAMWDGIENAGYGVHDENATVWKDLIGSADWTLTSNATVVSNSLQCAGLSATGAGVTLADGMQIELYATVEPRTPGYRCIANLDKNHIMESLILYRYNNSMLTLGGRYEGFVYASAGIHGWSISLKGVKAIPSGHNYSAENLYLDGNATKLDGTGNWWRSFKSTDYSNYASLGAFNYNGEDVCPYKGRIFSIRVYNRKLTADEARHNYALDVERFGATL